MSVPKYDEMMIPVLEALSTGKPVSTKELRSYVIEAYQLDEEAISELIPSGVPRYANNVLWACPYLKQAGLIVSPKRSIYQILPEGEKLIKSGIRSISGHDLMKYPQFQNFIKRSRKTKATHGPTVSNDKDSLVLQEVTPEDTIENAYQSINDALVDDLLSTVTQQSSVFFERLVVELLLAIGYGSFQEEAGTVTKRSGDEGIDGIIRQDKLGFDSIYVQAKCWDPNRTVQRPVVQSFVGALTGVGANKGLLITTAKFSSGAQEYARKQHAIKLVLVDGSKLARLMIEHNLGVSIRKSYELKSIDRDFFDLDS